MFLKHHTKNKKYICLLQVFIYGKCIEYQEKIANILNSWIFLLTIWGDYGNIVFQYRMQCISIYFPICSKERNKRKHWKLITSRLRGILFDFFYLFHIILFFLHKALFGNHLKRQFPILHVLWLIFFFQKIHIFKLF